MKQPLKLSHFEAFEPAFHYVTIRCQRPRCPWVHIATEPTQVEARRNALKAAKAHERERHPYRPQTKRRKT